jgi:hypothetical protein
LKSGYDEAYRSFYSWGSILRSSLAHIDSPSHAARQFCYSAGWKKFEPFWDLAIRLKQLGPARPLLESILSTRGQKPRLAPRIDETCDPLRR